MKRRARGTRDAEASKRALIDAATKHFASHGLEGARIDQIATAAGVNKQLVYHHFGSKDRLYLNVLEEAYNNFRQGDDELELPSLDPVSAIRKLIAANVERMQKHRHFTTLVIDENFHRARHLRHSRQVREIHARLLMIISEVLRRGEQKAVFRRGVDPLQLYTSIASLSAFYVTNAYTLTAIFGEKFQRLCSVPVITTHVEDLILGYLTSDSKRAPRRRRSGGAAVMQTQLERIAATAKRVPSDKKA